MLTVPKTFKSMLINSHHSDSYNDKMQLNLKKQKSDVSKVAKLDKFADSQVEKLIRDAGAFRVSGAAITRFNDILTQKCLTAAWNQARIR